MKPIIVVAAALAAAIPLAAAAQAGKLFSSKDLSEGALVRALKPTETVKTRSLRVRPSEAGAPADAAAQLAEAERPSASLLITFETNSAELTPRAMASLDIVGRALRSAELAEFRFQLEGHADPRGSDELNDRLSQARAESVLRYLTQRHGIDPQRLTATGKGARELANLRDPTAPENRRVTIVNLLN